MSRSELFEQLTDIVKEHFAEYENLDDSTDLVKDLNADSLDFVDFVMEVEEKFQVSISDEESEKLLTLGAIVDFIEYQRREGEYK